MTVSTQTNKVSFTGTGANTALATGFPFIDDTDLVVTKRVTATGAETTLVLNTHYTVTGGTYANGTVTPVDGATDFPTSVTWTIKRVTPKTQATDYVANDNFGAETHERALDKVTYLKIDSQEELDRSLKVAVTDADPATLPNSVDRASKYLGFDASGDPTPLSAPTDTSITSAFAETLLDDVDAATARATLDAQEAVITTRGDIVRGSSGGGPAAERLAVGASGTYLRSDGTDVSYSALVAADVAAVVALPRGYLSGLTITRTSATEFNVGKGICRAGTASDQDLVNGENTNAAFGKLFDNGGWDAGDGGGGVPTAAGFATAIDTWHFFMLIKSDGSAYDFGWDTDIAAVNLIADAAVFAQLGAAARYRRIGSFPSTATPDLADFDQYGDDFLLVASAQDIQVTTPGTASVSHTLPSVPDGLVVGALVSIIINESTGFHKVGHGGATLGVPSDNDKDLETATGLNEQPHWSGKLMTTTAQIIKTRSSTDPTQVDIQVRGWVDRRGRDD